MKKEKIAIIGAGPAGLTAAYCLAKNGYNVSVYEASNYIGGICRSIEIWNQKADLGPHRFFSKNEKVNTLWKEMADENFTIIKRQTRILYNGSFFQYPIAAKEILKKLGVYYSAQCFASYLKQKIKPSKYDNSFESAIKNKFGEKLYKTFFKSYSEKLWGINCADLDADFASQRIKGFSFYEAIVNMLITRKNKPKTLLDQFPYPLKGSGAVYEEMAKRIEKHGGTIYLNKKVVGLKKVNNKVEGLTTSDNTFYDCDHIISSMPLSELVFMLPDVPSQVIENAKKLQFRNSILVYLLVEGANLFPDNWLYIHSPDLLTGRITNFRNWSKELYGDQKNTVLVLEYWCNSNDSIWHFSNQELISLAESELKKTGLNKAHPIIDGHIERIPKSYPIYFKGYKNVLEPISDFLKKTSNIQAIGRYGAYKYNNQDHSILMGIMAAKNVSQPQKHNLWEVNTDYEDYQED